MTEVAAFCMHHFGAFKSSVCNLPLSKTEVKITFDFRLRVCPARYARRVRPRNPSQFSALSRACRLLGFPLRRSPGSFRAYTPRRRPLRGMPPPGVFPTPAPKKPAPAGVGAPAARRPASRALPWLRRRVGFVRVLRAPPLPRAFPLLSGGLSVRVGRGRGLCPLVWAAPARAGLRKKRGNYCAFSARSWQALETRQR